MLVALHAPTSAVRRPPHPPFIAPFLSVLWGQATEQKTLAGPQRCLLQTDPCTPGTSHLDVGVKYVEDFLQQLNLHQQEGQSVVPRLCARKQP